MITFLSFLAVIAGGVNWFCIGFLQYDFIAGIFGTQASLFSRLFYIIIGLASLWLFLMAIVHRGEINIFNPRFKKTINSDVLGNNSAKQK